MSGYIHLHRGEYCDRLNGPVRPLPHGLPMRALAALFPGLPLTVWRFFLLPRLKRPLGTFSSQGCRPGKTRRIMLRVVFDAALSKLMRWLRDNQFEARLLRPRHGTARLEAKIENSISDSRLLTAMARRRLLQGQWTLAVSLAQTALLADPENVHAIAVIILALRMQPAQVPSEAAREAEACLARCLIRLAAAIRYLRPAVGCNPMVARAVQYSEKCIRIMRAWWGICRCTSSPLDAPCLGPDRTLLGRLVSAAFDGLDATDDGALERFFAVPEISAVITRLLKPVEHMPQGVQEALAGELRYRIWRVLFVDCRIPDSRTASGFAEELYDAIDQCYRPSNDPDRGCGDHINPGDRPQGPADDGSRGEDHDSDEEDQEDA